MKNYNIPLPPVLSKKIGKHNAVEHDKTRLCERHFPSAIPKGEGKKEKGLPGAVLFVAISLASFSNRKEHLIGVKNVENRYVLSLASKFTTQKGISKNSPIRG